MPVSLRKCGFDHSSKIGSPKQYARVKRYSRLKPLLQGFRIFHCPRLFNGRHPGAFLTGIRRLKTLDACLRRHDVIIPMFTWRGSEKQTLLIHHSRLKPLPHRHQ
jgi:hypothetical protein